MNQNPIYSPVGWDTVVIANGTSLSPEINTGGYVPAGLIIPATWTAANLTFQGSNITAGTFADVYDDAGTEYTVIAAASRYILLDPRAFCSFQFWKIRSGTTGTPVNQGAARTLILEYRDIGRYR